MGSITMGGPVSAIVGAVLGLLHMAILRRGVRD